MKQENKYFRIENNGSDCDVLNMNRFVYRKFKRANKKLQPADLDSEEEKQAEDFLRKKEDKEKRAEHKNKDIKRLTE